MEIQLSPAINPLGRYEAKLKQERAIAQEVKLKKKMRGK